MRRKAKPVVLAIVGAAVLAGPTMGAGPRPSLRLVDRDPVRVRGTHFGSREIVRVTFTIGAAKALRRVRAGKGGGFVATFRSRAWVGACSPGLTIVAVGMRGSRALLKLPAAACPPTAAH